MMLCTQTECTVCWKNRLLTIVKIQFWLVYFSYLSWMWKCLFRCGNYLKPISTIFSLGYLLILREIKLKHMHASQLYIIINIIHISDVLISFILSSWLELFQLLKGFFWQLQNMTKKKYAKLKFGKIFQLRNYDNKMINKYLLLRIHAKL